MIRVTVDTIRISLRSPERAILLKELEQERQLPIFIHATEAEAIAAELEGYRPPRPLTHDLLKNTIEALGGDLQYVLVNDLRDNIFYAVLHIVRARVPIYVAEEVMEAAGVYPAVEIEQEQEDLAVFRDFVETLDLGEE
jgi:bifunctional DNase/RNase